LLTNFAPEIPALISDNSSKKQKHMHNNETKDRFVELRSFGWSYGDIANELKIAKSTAIDWGRKFDKHINNLRALELEAMQQRLLGSREERFKGLVARLRRFEHELDLRNTNFFRNRELIRLIVETQHQIDRLLIDPKFVEETVAAEADPTQPPTNPTTP